MYSITFRKSANDVINTFEDWHLIPTSRPNFTPAELLSNYVETPGVDGSIDLLKLTLQGIGGSNVGNSTGSFEFILDNGDNFDYGQWYERYSAIMNWLHGKRLGATLCETGDSGEVPIQPERYYEGRFWVSGFNSGASFSIITISYETNIFLEEV